MKGALWHLAVGGLEVGTFIDTDGRKMLACRGQTVASNADKVALAIRSVTISIEHGQPLPELERTEPLFLMTEKWK